MKKNTRKCIACGTRSDKHELIRVNRGKDGTVSLETGKHQEGRGAYICHHRACIEKTDKKRLLSRALKTNVNLELMRRIYE